MKCWMCLQGHAHLETARREPWLFGEPPTTRIRDAIRLRYAMLPYIYTLFRHANLTGKPHLHDHACMQSPCTKVSCWALEDVLHLEDGVRCAAFSSG